MTFGGRHHLGDPAVGSLGQGSQIEPDTAINCLPRQGTFAESQEEIRENSSKRDTITI